MLVESALFTFSWFMIFSCRTLFMILHRYLVWNWSSCCGAGIAEWVSELELAIALLCSNHYIGCFEPRLVPLSKVLYHTCFISGQRFKCWSRRPKLTSSVISDVKPIIYIYIYVLKMQGPRFITIEKCEYYCDFVDLEHCGQFDAFMQEYLCSVSTDCLSEFCLWFLCPAIGGRDSAAPICNMFHILQHK